MADAIVLPDSDECRWAIQALGIHRAAYRFFGVASKICGMCDKRWGEHGCGWRRNAIKAIHAHLRTFEEREPLVALGLLTYDEALNGVAKPLQRHRRPRRRPRWLRRSVPFPHQVVRSVAVAPNAVQTRLAEPVR
jgi:hypothetical protein